MGFVVNNRFRVRGIIPFSNLGICSPYSHPALGILASMWNLLVCSTCVVSSPSRELCTFLVPERLTSYWCPGARAFAGLVAYGWLRDYGSCFAFSRNLQPYRLAEGRDRVFAVQKTDNYRAEFRMLWSASLLPAGPYTPNVGSLFYPLCCTKP